MPNGGLYGAKWTETHLKGAEETRDSVMPGTTRTILGGRDLRGSDLRGANLYGSEFLEAVLAQVEHCKQRASPEERQKIERFVTVAEIEWGTADLLFSLPVTRSSIYISSTIGWMVTRSSSWIGHSSWPVHREPISFWESPG